MATMHRAPPRPVRNLHKLYAVVVAGFLAGIAPATPAWAQDTQEDCSREPPPPAETIHEVPWTQGWLAPERVWSLSQGDGVVVAVIDTGVDVRHPQLRGQVRSGRDTIGDTTGRVDCDGSSHGTAVASVIAATPAEGVGFAGLAPGATILPIRVAETAEQGTRRDGEPPVAPDQLADAIEWATDQDAHVINLSVVFYRDHPVVAEAVADALAQGMVVVAAVGNQRDEDGLDLTPYPAAYPGVVGVGGLSADGLGSATYVGPEVDLLAPGEAVTVAAAGDGHRVLSGSSFATPFVSAAAALLLAADGTMTGPEVVRRLLATADPGPGTNDESGFGVVDPYQALAARVVDEAPVPAQPLPPVEVDEAALKEAAQWRDLQGRAALIAGAALAAGLLCVVARTVWRRGRDRGWRPGPRPEVAPPAEPELADEPQRRFFTVPTPGDLAPRDSRPREPAARP